MRLPPIQAHAEPGLAVVVPTLDEARALPRLLARLLSAQIPTDDRADEVIVADGGSRDATLALAASAAGATVLRAPRGRGAQLAEGARASTRDLLLFLHADCVPADGALRALREAFRNPQVSIAALHQRIEAAGWFYRLVERAADARCRRGMVYGDSGLALRRTAYLEAGGFRPLRLFEDVDFSRRLGRVGRVHLVEGATLLVSARRWQREGALRCTLRNWILRASYALGVSPERLARHYGEHSRAESRE